MIPPNILRAAQVELAEAVEWYESRRPGLGIAFLGAVDLAIRGIAEAPQRFAPWGANQRFRRVMVDRFPYFVFFHLAGGKARWVAQRYSADVVGL